MEEMMKMKELSAADDDQIAGAEEEEEEETEEELISSETSSIGVCSDHDEGEEEEVQSKGIDDPNDKSKSSLTSLDSLEDSLPFKRGLSNFYSGKSKSFTSLSNVATATAKDLVKPDNPFNKRRRLLLAWSHSRRASCSNLASITRSPSLLPLLPPVLSECDEDDDDEDGQDEDEEQTTTTTLMMRRMRSRSDKEKKRPSLFTVTVAPPQQVLAEYDNGNDNDDDDNDNDNVRPLPTPKSSRSGGGMKMRMALRSPGRSFSLSDLSQHALAHAPP